MEAWYPAAAGRIGVLACFHYSQALRDRLWWNWFGPRKRWRRNPYLLQKMEMCAPVRCNHLPVRGGSRRVTAQTQKVGCLQCFCASIYKKWPFLIKNTRLLLVHFSVAELKRAKRNLWALYFIHAYQLNRKSPFPRITTRRWLKLQQLRPRLGIRSDLQRGTFFTRIKTRSCSPRARGIQI